MLDYKRLSVLLLAVTPACNANNTVASGTYTIVDAAVTVDICSLFPDGLGEQLMTETVVVSWDAAEDAGTISIGSTSPMVFSCVDTAVTVCDDLVETEGDVTITQSLNAILVAPTQLAFTVSVTWDCEGESCGDVAYPCDGVVNVFAEPVEGD